MPRGKCKASPLVVGTLSGAVQGCVQEGQFPPKAQDRAAIASTMDAYFQAWFEGDTVTMERCLHPDLTARLFQTGEGSGFGGRITTLPRPEGIQASLGPCVPPGRRQCGVSVLDVSRHSASARAVLGDWVAYVHLSFTRGRWAIVNVMWEWISSRNCINA